MSNNKYFQPIFEDDDILVIDKSAGVETTASVSGSVSIEELMANKVERSGIVHRLDKDTSGVMVIAKNHSVYDNLKRQFADHEVKKVYWTLVAGNIPNAGEIKSYLARDPKRQQAMKAVAYPSGLERGKLRPATTRYKKIKAIKIGESEGSLAEVEIKTGRTHQIRVHLQSINHPVLGDKMYFSKLSRELSQKIGLKRQFLHAQLLEFDHPASGKKVKFVSPLPVDLKRYIC